MKDEIPDGVPADFVPAFMPLVEPTDGDFFAVAMSVRRSREALIESGFDPGELSAPSLEWVAQQAWNRAAARACPPPSGYFQPAPRSAIGEKLDKFNEALLGEASDEEILGLANEVRARIREQREADKWKSGTGD